MALSQWIAGRLAGQWVSPGFQLPCIPIDPPRIPIGPQVLLPVAGCLYLLIILFGVDEGIMILMGHYC